MGKALDSVARIVAGHPKSALLALLIVTAGLASGTLLLGPQANSSVFLPNGSEVARASSVLSESFPDSAGLTNVNVVHRGPVLTPAGLGHMQDVVEVAVSDPAVAGRLALDRPVVSVVGIFGEALAVDDLSQVSQEQIDAAEATLRMDPMLGPLLKELMGTADGTGLAISSIHLREMGDLDGLREVELSLAETVASVEGPLWVRALSAGTMNEEATTSSESSMNKLMVLALAVIAALLLVFFRSGFDLVIALIGLTMTIAGTIGFQGYLGPNGLGVIGLPNQITTMVPIMLIGLIVDYALQSVSHYREFRIQGCSVAEASRRGLRGVLLPLGLAATTTIISFLTNLTSPIPANKDFGILAGFGVFFGLTVMLVLMSASRAVFDGRRESESKLSEPAMMANAIPGAGLVVEKAGAFVARHPLVVLGATVVVTVALGAAATQISTKFDANDFLPPGGESLEDIDDLNEALGGQTEVATLLVESELTDDRTLRNIFQVMDSFDSELTRPAGAASNITVSLGYLFTDWITDSGEPGDKFDPELVAVTEGLDQGLTLNPGGVQAVLDRLEENDPIGFEQVAVNNPNGLDKTLIQFNALTGDQNRTQQLIDDIEGQWFGDREEITLVSDDVIGLVVTDSMTESQTTSIVVTIAAAMTVLILFFWATEFKPMLAVIAVTPIVLVLTWVLGTMTILDIPYNVVTALITALSIGIGVDYTIHVIHRFGMEFEEHQDLAIATQSTLATTGSALIGSALTTALGFGVLMLSPLAPFQQFGLITGITILFALIASVVVVPPMLVMWVSYHGWRATSLKPPAGAAATSGREAPASSTRTPHQ